MSELERAKHIRTGLRTGVTRVANEINTLTAISADQVSDLTILQLEGKLAFLKDKETDLLNRNKEIENLICDDEIDRELESVLAYDEKIKMAMCMANGFIKIFKEKLTLKTHGGTNRNAQSALETGTDSVFDHDYLAQNSSQGTSSSSQTVNMTVPKTVKLPVLQFPKFNGDLTKWTAWWERFNSSIHQNPSLSVVDKFSYMRSLLTEVAESAIAGIPVTADNYEEAVNRLQKRFGKNEAVANAHIRRLLTLNPMKNGSLQEMRNLYDVVVSNVAALKTLEVPRETYEMMLRTKVKDMFTKDLAKDFRLTKRDNALEDLLDFLAKEIEAREEDECVVLERGAKVPDTKKVSRQPVASTKNHGSSVSTLNAGVETRKKFCLFCNSSDHWAEACTKDMPVSERKQMLSKKGRCFRCIRGRHLVKDCAVKNLKCTKCGGGHLTILCDPKLKKDTSKESESKAVLHQQTKDNSVFLLQTMLVDFQSDEKKIAGRCLLDGGGMRTFIKRSFSESLGLTEIGTEDVVISTFGGHHATETCRRVRLKLCSRVSSHQLTVEALEIDEICSNVISLPSKDVAKLFKAQQWEMADPPRELRRRDDAVINLLIGADYQTKIVCNEICKINERLLAMKTIFGWVVSGPQSTNSAGQQPYLSSVCTLHMMVAAKQVFDEPRKQMEKFWSLEHIGILPESTAEVSQNSVLEDPEFNGERYCVSWPWKDRLQQDLGDNYQVAKGRLKQLVRKLRADPDKFEEYNHTLREYLQDGVIERVEDPTKHGTAVYYMPHRPVYKKERETTKLRIVFDASSHASDKRSLNECLWQGPDMMHQLFDILLRFRLKKIAVVADIEKAFLQICLNKNDRDAARFLWMDISENKQKEEIFRMTRVLFGVTSSPALLAHTLLFLFKKKQTEFPRTVELLEKSFYVDDLVTGAESMEEASRLREEADLILRSGGFNLRKWQSSHPELCEQWKVEQKDFMKILGLVWNVKEDTLAVASIKESGGVQCVRTKRQVLQHVSQVYDPFGWLSPFTIRMKALLQSIWKLNVDWDAALPEEILTTWRGWALEANAVENLTIERWLGWNGVEESELHVFVDASKTAYATVIFLRLIVDAEVQIKMVTSKARVAPLKAMTLPRLELMAALLGVRLWNQIKQCFKGCNSYFWSDSQIVLNWIKGPSYKWKPFVANRVVEIQNNTSPLQWKFCPGSLNPADVPSRGTSVESIEDWWDGPNWLRLPPDQWTSKDEAETEECPDEQVEEIVTNTVNVEVQDTVLANRFSSAKMMVRVMAWVNRFLKLCRKREAVRGPLSAGEIYEAEMRCIKEAQQRGFSEEFSALSKEGTIPKQSPLHNFNCYLDQNGLIRLRSRLQFGDVSTEEKDPIILPPEDSFVRLLVIATHRRMMHGGVNETLTELRERFWIIRGRQVVKKIIQKCLQCQKLHSPLMKTPTAALPPERSSYQPAFTVTGIDFAGPVLVKDDHGERKKTYIALFTCAVSRAVHLELITSMSADAFILAFRRFIGRRGICSTIFSDNALTFKTADKEFRRLTKISKSKPVQNFAADLKIEWKFVVERAPWWGGFWERMVRSVKNALKKTLGQGLLTFEEMATVLVEVESVVNSRPLTYVSNDGDEPTALTPSHFLVGQRTTILPRGTNGKLDPAAVTVGELRRRLHVREKMLEHFSRRWKSDYLLQLRSAHEKKDVGCAKQVEVGDLVLLSKENTARHRWPMGKILELRQGRDGNVRSGTVKLTDGTVIRRPLNLMVPLEMSTD